MYETTWALGICYGSLTSTSLPPSFSPPSALQHLLLTYVHALYIDQNSICAAFLTTFKAERTSRQKKKKEEKKLTLIEKVYHALFRLCRFAASF